ncbi:ATP-binding cassette domain-containing protein [Ancylobacter oerskovii]|uniref:ATP-binding cassette domain-containing protein n=1 Tax=Ancylobacter oerskovii TaxID=459519 RepID=A0ABW4YZI9_9HYPH|nr:cysteine peptidase family C39 domain-containing protein [Ancylobacter oerskovii]MBS7541632.1 ATP-binding cassette domain-containing protein [Ancylobacter oerskovii]
MPARRRTPTLLQMEATECGAAALGIVLAYYGRWVTLEELRVACNVTRDGSSARSIVRAARGEGLEVDAARMEPADLRNMAMPVIIHWGMDHFLVVEGFGRGTVYLNDPAQGPRRVSDEEFDRGFTGIVLSLRPGPGFQRTERPPSLARSLARRLEGSRSALAFVVMISLAMVVPGLLVPAFAQFFIDQILINSFDDWLGYLLLGMVGCAAAMGLLTWLQREVLLRLETRLAIAGGLDFATHILRLPISYFAQRQPAQVAGRTALNNRLAQLLAVEVGAALSSLLTALAYLAAMLFYAPDLGLIVLLLGLGNLGLLAWSSRALDDDNRRLLAATTGHAGFVRQGLRMIDTYKASGTEHRLRERLTAMNARALNLRQSIGVAQMRLGALPGLTAAIAGALVLMLGGIKVIAGEMSLGMLVAFQALMMGFLGPVATLVQLGARIQDGHANLRLLDDTLDHPVAPEFIGDDAAAGGHGGRLLGAVAAKEVGFRHGAGSPLILDGVSFALEPGERLGITGASGSGKSTLASLIAGLHQTSAGTILLDGVPLPDVPRSRLRQSLAYVDQRAAIFEGTVRDNIGLWDHSLPDERIVAAARLALLHETVMRRGGYGSRLREGGTDLSGGQRARLEIARALVRDPRVLILDEATAALDSETERQLFANLRRNGATMIVIAHRYTALRECERILVLDAGRIIQHGPPGQLLAEPGHFHDLMRAG